MSTQLEHFLLVVFTVAMMLITYLIIKSLIGVTTPIAIFILFIDEIILFVLGAIGWRVDLLLERIKK